MERFREPPNRPHHRKVRRSTGVGARLQTQLASVAGGGYLVEAANVATTANAAVEANAAAVQNVAGATEAVVAAEAAAVIAVVLI